MAGRYGLNAKQIPTLPLTDDGKTKMHGDGRGLSVLVEPTKGGIVRSYNFRFTSPADGKQQIMRLGHIDELTLAAARERAYKYRAMLLDGKDPRHAIANTGAGQVTFKQYADENWDALTGGKPLDHVWCSSMRKLVGLHHLPIGTATLDQVYKVIEPLWRAHPIMTAAALQRASKIFNHARVRKLRPDNPALLEDLQALGLERARKLRPIKPHEALPFAELPAFMHQLSYHKGPCARAVEFAILTATRSQETREARWSWLNADMTTITIPKEYMKKRKEHVIPLATQVTEMLRTLPRTSTEWIFTSPHDSNVIAPLGAHALLNQANRVRPGATPIKLHGFRSTFRDYAMVNRLEEDFVLEVCLAHAPAGGSVRAAYARDNLIERRRAVMQAWADFATGKAAPANVVPFKKEVA